MANISCLMTTVVNTSGAGRHFGVLPPRGRYLAAGGEFSALGTVVDWLQGRGGLSPVSKKLSNALQKALEDGELEIKSTPSVALYDGTAEATVVLTIDDDVLAGGTPCWAA